MAKKITQDDALLREFRMLVSKANSRIDRLFKAGKTDSFAYRRAMFAIERQTGQWLKMPKEGKPPHFTSANPKNKNVLRARFNEVQEFLNAETSTLSGVKRLEKTATATIKDRYGLDLSVDQLEIVFEGALWEKLNTEFGSKTAIAILSAVQRNNGSISKAFADLADQHIFISSKERVKWGATIGNYMRGNKVDFLKEGF